MITHADYTVKDRDDYTCRLHSAYRRTEMITHADYTVPTEGQRGSHMQTNQKINHTRARKSRIQSEPLRVNSYNTHTHTHTHHKISLTFVHDCGCHFAFLKQTDHCV